MTPGLLLVIIVALGLFIGTSVLLFAVGLLFDAACGDFMAKAIVYAAFLVLWVLPSVAVAVGWWTHR